MIYVLGDPPPRNYVVHILELYKNQDMFMFEKKQVYMSMPVATGCRS